MARYNDNIISGSSLQGGLLLLNISVNELSHPGARKKKKKKKKVAGDLAWIRTFYLYLHLG
jgi:hypothetical protein